jgi:molecular chaperone DnaK
MMKDIEENGFQWPCGHENEEGATKCHECGMELVACGIDLGTTYSLCAICSEINPEKEPPFSVELSTHRQDRFITPSVVSLDRESGELLVGLDAVENQLQNPVDTVYSIKRLMGRRFDDQKVQYHLKRVKYHITKDESGMAAIKLGDFVYTPTQLSAMILERLKLDAEERFGKKITHAVISVPAYFDDIQRQATKEAGRMAGLFVKRIVSEPVAATYAYGYGLSSAKTGRILVFDMGGGTFDITIIRVIQPLNVVLTHEGDMWLGGDDVDEKLVDQKVKEIEEQYDIDPSPDAHFMVELRQQVRRAKEVLCSSKAKLEEKLHLNRPLKRKKNGETTESLEMKNLKLTRQEVQMAAAPLVDRAINIVKKAIKEANLAPGDINHVILAGGSSYLPGIQEKLRSVFPPGVIDEIKDPMASVATGVAVLARKIKGIYCDVCGHTNQSTAIKCVKCGSELEPFIERTHLPYGIEVKGGFFEEVMPKGTPCPTYKPQERIFYTAHNDQKKIDIPIYQGDKKMVKDNNWQGILPIQLKTGVPENTPVTVFMSINKDRLLEVEARCKGDQWRTSIKPSNWAYSLREMIKWSEKFIREMPQISEPVRQARQVLNEWDNAPPESKEARELSEKGKKILAELENKHWEDLLKFYTLLLNNLLDYHKLLAPAFVNQLRITLDLCQTARTEPGKVSRDTVETELNIVFVKLFRDDLSESLLIILLAFDSKAVDPDIRKVTKFRNTIEQLIKEGKVEHAKKITKDEKGRPYFKQVERKIFEHFEIPELLKSELGHGGDAGT